MGFGHRVYKVEDPRGRHLRAHAENLKDEGDPTMLETQARLVDVMRERKGLAINVDFYSATTYYSIGLDIDLFTPMFAMSRIAGWVGHCMEQLADNKLIRPRCEYVGPHEQPYVKIDKR